MYPDNIILKVFGKKGCKKCEMLMSRLTKLLTAKNLTDSIDIKYYDLTQEPALVEFCYQGCLNPSKIPACICTYQGQNLRPKDICVHSLKPVLGLQTVYEAGGVITPEMLESIVSEAIEQVTLLQNLGDYCGNIRPEKKAVSPS